MGGRHLGVSKRDLGLQPKRKVDGFDAAPGVPARQRQAASTRQSRARRRRVHTSVRLATAEALLSHVKGEAAKTNTTVLIEALTAQPELRDRRVDDSGFEARGPAERRTTVTFYLAGHEVDLIDSRAHAGGYRSRSAYLDDALHRHLVAVL